MRQRPTEDEIAAMARVTMYLGITVLVLASMGIMFWILG